MKKPTTPTTQPSGPNMAKQYRKELRALDTQIRRAKADRDRHILATERARGKALVAACRACDKIDKAASREICAINRTFTRLNKGTEKQIAAFQKRQAILLGRLS
jgi:hypothetical protein